MKIKNETGAFLTLGLGRRVGTELQAGQTKTVDDDPETVADAVTAAKAGQISIVEPPLGAELNFIAGTPTLAIVAVGAPADEETLVIGTETFEIDDDDTFTSENTQINISGSTDSIDIADGIKTAVNANAALDELGVKVRETIGGTDPTAAAYVIIELPASLTHATFAITGDTGLVVTDQDLVPPKALRQWIHRQAASATEELVVTPFASIEEYIVVVQDANGGYKAYDGDVSKSGGSLWLSANGDSDIAATDEIVILVFGF